MKQMLTTKSQKSYTYGDSGYPTKRMERHISITTTSDSAKKLMNYMKKELDLGIEV